MIYYDGILSENLKIGPKIYETFSPELSLKN